MKSGRIIHLFIFTMIYFSSFAQQEKRGYFGISAGPSFPIGDFRSNTTSNQNSGYAKPGLVVDLNLSYCLVKHFGITLFLRGQGNSLDVDNFRKDLFSNSSVNYTTESNRWVIGGLLAGIYTTFPLRKSSKIFFEGRVMVGCVNSTIPHVLISELSTPLIETKTRTTIAFAGLFGGGFHINLGQRTCLLINADFFIVDSDFRDSNLVTSIVSVNGPQSNQPMTTVNISTGIALRLK